MKAGSGQRRAERRVSLNSPPIHPPSMNIPYSKITADGLRTILEANIWLTNSILKAEQRD